MNGDLAAPEGATVYILPIPKDAARWSVESDLAPVPLPPNAIFSILIDGVHAVQVDTRGGAIVEGLDAIAVHTVRVTIGGKPFARFKFTFDQSWGFGSGPKRLAIYMDAMYLNWRVGRCDKVRRCDDLRADAGAPDVSKEP
jgi:hypothetical protein